jgi:hypothetical protein
MFEGQVEVQRRGQSLKEGLRFEVEVLLKRKGRSQKPGSAPTIQS